MTIMGIDPGTATTGWGIIEKQKDRVNLVAVGTIITKKTSSDAKRLEIIFNDIQTLLKQYKPDTVVVELLFFNTNAKTAMVVGQARGVVLVATSLLGIDLVSYTPLQIKMAITGYGRADKNQMQQMVKRLLTLPKVPKPDDAADALAVALTHAFTKRY